MQDPGAGGARVNYDELRRCVWGPWPGLRVKRAEVTERDLQGLWKRVDAGAHREVATQEFMKFMRNNGPANLKKAELGRTPTAVLAPEDEAPTPERTREELRRVTAGLDRALKGYFKSHGVLGGVPPAREKWQHFFELVDTERKGKLRFAEFNPAIREKVGRWLQAWIAEDAISSSLSLYIYIYIYSISIVKSYIAKEG